MKKFLYCLNLVPYLPSTARPKIIFPKYVHVSQRDTFAGSESVSVSPVLPMNDLTTYDDVPDNFMYNHIMKATLPNVPELSSTPSTRHSIKTLEAWSKRLPPRIQQTLKVLSLFANRLFARCEVFE